MSPIIILTFIRVEYLLAGARLLSRVFFIFRAGFVPFVDFLVLVMMATVLSFLDDLG
jgi:hypothetical protein